MRRRAALGLALLPWRAFAQPDDKRIYLSFDTGHMGVANLIVDTLRRFEARATFFLANEPTLTGGFTLDEEWAPWWKARAAEGHDFGSHTWDHDIWLEDLPGDRFKVRTVAGLNAPVIHELSAAQYAENLQRVASRFKAMTGQAMGPIFRAPGGKTSPALLAAAARAGFQHVGWAPAGFSGDELPSDKYPNAELLERALKNLRPGDIVLAHLGIWSRLDPWAPAVLEPLMRGLKERGMSFAPIREHPRYAPLYRKA
ncbi:MAG: polysaccharide deacetylase family protein [Paucibacter sp.]|nr:polysaccharide deacetylase family protein [Roseateles sp.]